MRILSIFLLAFAALLFAEKSFAQVDLNNLDLKDIIGKVMHVEKGFAPKFSLGRTPIQKVSKVAEILGLKQNEDVNKLFKTFKTGTVILAGAGPGAGTTAAGSFAGPTPVVSDGVTGVGAGTSATGGSSGTTISVTLRLRCVL